MGVEIGPGITIGPGISIGDVVPRAITDTSIYAYRETNNSIIYTPTPISYLGTRYQLLTIPFVFDNGLPLASRGYVALVVNRATSVTFEYLAVGGGGWSGYETPYGGGGAGALWTGSFTVTPGTKSKFIKVGKYGDSFGGDVSQRSGYPTRIETSPAIVVPGGGGGGYKTVLPGPITAYINGDAGTGGSAGGGGGPTGTTAGAGSSQSGQAVFGYAGANQSGGGGGLGSAGTTGPSGAGGNAILFSFGGISSYYGAGGAGWDGTGTPITDPTYPGSALQGGVLKLLWISPPLA